MMDDEASSLQIDQEQGLPMETETSQDDMVEENSSSLAMDSGVSVLLSPEEFAEDLDLRLGRANGNVYQRKEGVDGMHDGQIMVRLKKKRFIVIDYGILPTEADIQAAAVSPHVATPEGAGKQKCITPDCTKIGVPVLLYDSAPDEPASLYMRSGLCFTCQRVLNEKRRTQRKRKSDVSADPATPQQSYTLTSGQKKFRINGDIIDLSPDAIVINGPVDGAKHQGDGYAYPEIAVDLQAIIRDAAHNTDRLVTAVTNATGSTHAAMAFAAAAAVANMDHSESEQHVSDDVVASAANAAVEASNGMLEDGNPAEDSATSGQTSTPTMSSDDISAIYERAFVSMSKAIFLLSQWKASWDMAIAAAVAQETVNDTGLADAVASAAAVVAASAEGHDQNSTNMIPLLLAAEAKGDDDHVQIKDEPEDEAALQDQSAHVENESDNAQVFSV